MSTASPVSAVSAGVASAHDADPAAGRPRVRRSRSQASAGVDFVFTRRGGLLYAVPVTLVLFLMPLAQSALRPRTRFLSGSAWADAGLGSLLFLAVFGIVFAAVNAHRQLRAVSGAEAALSGWSSRRI